VSRPKRSTFDGFAQTLLTPELVGHLQKPAHHRCCLLEQPQECYGLYKHVFLLGVNVWTATQSPASDQWDSCIESFCSLHSNLQVLPFGDTANSSGIS